MRLIRAGQNRTGQDMTGQDRTVMDRMVQHSSKKKYFRVVHNYQKFSTLFIYAQILCLFSYNDNPEITEMVQFLDPETAKILQFLDPETVKMDEQNFWIQKWCYFWIQKS